MYLKIITNISEDEIFFYINGVHRNKLWKNKFHFQRTKFLDTKSFKMLQK